MHTTSERRNTIPRLVSPGELAIELSAISIRYRVTADTISSLKEHVIRRILGRRVEHREIWALRDLDLRVFRGESLGVIGRNGAGKSTLMKVVARVLRPTAGTIWVKGNVAPLLELGGGMHPELTGLENIFLKGALLGFSRSQMEERVERIIAFSGLADFIDVPLRTYSSGMITRLGFAIATDVDTDILLIDEVLSVGDLEFQEKAVARLLEFRKSGTTIFFVSHALESVGELCDRSIWLDKGRLRADGPTQDIIRAYSEHTQANME